jgi:signal peptidase II
VIFGVFYIRKIIEKKYNRGFIICVGLIFAGALGNLIDSMFYGLIFTNSSLMLFNVAKIFPANGYAGFLHGNVVDMLYFPIIHTRLPDWVPFWGGQYFDFFSPIFNLADASISTGIITIFIFQKRFFKTTTSNIPVLEKETVDEIQIS